MKNFLVILVTILVLSFSNLTLADEPTTDPEPDNPPIVEPDGPIEPPVPK